MNWKKNRHNNTKKYIICVTAPINLSSELLSINIIMPVKLKLHPHTHSTGSEIRLTTYKREYFPSIVHRHYFHRSTHSCGSDAPDGLSHRTIWGGPHRKLSGKRAGTVKKCLAGDWMSHLPITVYQGQTLDVLCTWRVWRLKGFWH